MKRKMWSCMETQKHVIPFIDDQLSISDLDAFLYHMEHCPDCKEEYDVYYTLLMGMRFLESDNMSALKMDSEQKLCLLRTTCINIRLNLLQRSCALCCCALA